MDNEKSMAQFRDAPIARAVLKNALPAMAAMLMVLVYHLADTFFIGQTGDDLQVAAVSLATPVFLIFMPLGMTGLVWAQPAADAVSLGMAYILYRRTERKMLCLRAEINTPHSRA